MCVWWPGFSVGYREGAIQDGGVLWLGGCMDTSGQCYWINKKGVTRGGGRGTILGYMEDIFGMGIHIVGHGGGVIGIFLGGAGTCRGGQCLGK